MKPLLPANSVSVAPDVIGNATVPFALFSNAPPTLAATPSALPTPERVLRVCGPVRSMYDSTRVRLSPIDNVIVKTASTVPSGVTAPDAVPTRSVSRPS